MSKYKTIKVPVELIFIGTVTVRAFNRKEANIIVKNNFNAIFGYCSNNNCIQISNWDINMHSNETRIKNNK